MSECLKVSVCNVKIGKCIFTTCERVFFFFLFPLTHCELIVFLFSSFHPTAKTNIKKRQKNPVTRLLSFIFVLFTFLLETIMFVMVTSNGKLHIVF